MDDALRTAPPAAERGPVSVPAARTATGAAPPAAAEPGVRRRARVVLGVVSAAVFMSNLDLFIVNIAFPDIHRDLGGGLSTLSWVLNGYAIAFAALLVPAGRLADRYGHRGGFLLGTALFTAASALCAASPGIVTLVVGRVAQAAGAALLLPTSLALLLAATPPARRAAAVRGWAAVGGLAAALGPVAGGLLVEADWRWVFLVNLPVGIATLVLGARVLPRRREDNPGPLPDLVGVLALTAGIGLLALGLVESSDWGWGSAAVIGSLAGAALLLAGFVARSARHPAPVVELSVLRSPGFSPAIGALFLFSVAFAAMLLSLVTYMDSAWGWSALKIGLAVTPGPAMVPPVALLLAGRLVARFGLGRVAGTGALIYAVGAAWWALRVGLHTHYAAGILPGMLLTGVGVGLVLPTLTAGATTVLPADRFATGSAVMNMSRQVASVLGVAVLIAVVGAPARQHLVSAFHEGWWFVAASSLAASVIAFAGLRPRRPAPSLRPEPGGGGA
ncbi:MULTISPECIES: MFS transporter [Pseudofrankia]|uniref:MFS transporter n=1 Tax=Pseudofrankia TaxID=2994363 RepID=UPI000234CEBB|nr:MULTISPECIES: MFS transporter [Pseudofrankia]